MTLEYVKNALQRIQKDFWYLLPDDESNYINGIFLYKGEKYKEALASLKKAMKDMREFEDNSGNSWVKKVIQDCIVLTESVLEKQKRKGNYYFISVP